MVHQHAHMHIANCLSRVGHKESKIPIPGMKITVDDLATQSCMAAIGIDEIREESMANTTLREVSEYVITGWPSSKAEIADDKVRDFHTFQDEIGLIEGILMKGNRIIIPESLQPRVLNTLHYHQVLRRLEAWQELVFIGLE